MLTRAADYRSRYSSEGMRKSEKISERDDGARSRCLHPFAFVSLVSNARICEYATTSTKETRNSVAVVSEATNKFIERVLAWRLPDRTRLDDPEGDERALENPP